MPNTFNLLSKWRNFAESGHTGTKRKRMTEECWNQGYVMIVLNRALLSSMRFCNEEKFINDTNLCLSTRF